MFHVEHQTETLKNCPICGSKKLEKSFQTKDYFLTQEEFNICRCKKCDFHFTSPRPKATHLSPYYKSDEYISHSNSNKGLFGFLYQRVRKITLLRKYLLINNFRRGNSILDIGCATGQLLQEFKSRGWDCVGIEPDLDARSLAEKKYHLKVFGEEGIGLLEDSSFDVISMFHVLEHVSNIDERMNDLKRLIKANGYVFIALPNIESWDAQHYKEFWAGLDVPRHLYHFKKDNVKQLFENYNFKIVKIIPMLFDAYYVSLLSEKYKKNPLYYPAAFFKGWYSNFRARKKSPNHSSLLYVIKPGIV